MIAKRIIPCLDVRDGRVVKGVNFAGLKDVNDPVTLARFYNEQGADKVSVNSGALRRPELIAEGAKRYGSQCVVLSVDVRRVGENWHVFAKGGREDTGLEALAWIHQAEQLGAGELVINSMDTDGVKQGFDLDLLKAVSEITKLPIVASGGAGKSADFIELFQLPNIEAGLAASIFHYGEVKIPELKKQLQAVDIPVRIV